MPLSAQVRNALDEAGVAYEIDAPLARRVWWRVGGPADALVTVPSQPALVAVQHVSAAHGLPLFVLGNGSNLLVDDAGIHGLVVVLTGALTESHARDGLLEVGGGLELTVLLARAARHGWAGLECLAGIPGTVGGGVRMNAGTSLGEIADILVSIDVVLADGTPRTLSVDELGARYRATRLPEGAVVSRATLRLGGDLGESQDRMRRFLDRRKASQPLDMPSCGSTFTNPAGDHAGRLIEAAGLKGHAIGGARVSPKHANFIVNTGGATAADIRALIEHVRETVEDRFGVRLEPEVKLAGRWDTRW